MTVVGSLNNGLTGDNTLLTLRAEKPTPMP
ncbi:MAG: hypothetical protein AAFW95_08465 [Cyanobacteria bacterium J06638_6]